MERALSKTKFSNIRDLLGHICTKHPYRVALVVFLMTAVSLTQGTGMALVVPLLSLTSGGNAVSGNRIVEGIASAFSRVGLEFSFSSVLLLVVLVVFSEALLKFQQQRFCRRFIGNFVADLQIELFQSCFDASWQFWLRKPTGYLSNNLTTESVRLLTAVDQMNIILANVILITVFLGVALTISFWFTILLLISGSFIFLFLREHFVKAQEQGDAIGTYNRVLHQVVGEHLQAAKLIKSSAMEEATVAAFRNAVFDLNETEISASSARFRIEASFNSIVVMLLCLGFYIGSVQLHLQSASALVILLIFYRILGPLTATQQAWHTLLFNAPAYGQMRADLKEAQNSVSQQSGSRSCTLTGGIELQNVTYGYEPSAPIFQDLSMSIPANTTVAIVGESGAGKTTILDLMLGLLEPQKGSILVGGIDLREIDKKTWRSQVGYLPQETFLFNDTIANNIRWGNSSATFAEIENSARLANAHEFIAAMPEGNQTIVGNRGGRLSGGERQRIALARALLRYPKLLFLDEATGALDSISERGVQEAIDGLKCRMTIIIVSHRLSTIRNADWIYVLVNGGVVEAGTWEQLIEKKGIFTELWSLQNTVSKDYRV